MSSARLFLLLVVSTLFAGVCACAGDDDPLQGLRPARSASTLLGDAGGTSTQPTAVDVAPKTAFTDVAAYALVTPPDESSNHHLGDSNAGKDCLSCHTGEGAPQFVVGGTVLATKTGNDDIDGVAGVQVRVVSATGEEIALVGTDSSGNFWLEGDLVLPAGSRVGVRSASSTKTMSGTVGNGSCNQSGCHVSPQPIFLSD
jgi:hypothetical protein